MNPIVVKHASNTSFIVWYLRIERFALESFWPFGFYKKLVVLRFFNVLLSGVCVQAEISMERCYQPLCLTSVLSSTPAVHLPLLIWFSLAFWLEQPTDQLGLQCLGHSAFTLPPVFLALLWGLQHPDSDRVKLGRWSKQNAAHVIGDNTHGFAQLHVNCYTCFIFVNTIRLLQLLNWLLQGSAL